MVLYCLAPAVFLLSKNAHFLPGFLLLQAHGFDFSPSWPPYLLFKGETVLFFWQVALQMQTTVNCLLKDKNSKSIFTMHFCTLACMQIKQVSGSVMSILCLSALILSQNVPPHPVICVTDSMVLVLKGSIPPAAHDAHQPFGAHRHLLLRWNHTPDQLFHQTFLYYMNSIVPLKTISKKIFSFEI